MIEVMVVAVIISNDGNGYDNDINNHDDNDKLLPNHLKRANSLSSPPLFV